MSSSADTTPVKFRFAAEGVQQTQGAALSVRKAFEQLDDKLRGNVLSLQAVGAAFRGVASLAGIGGVGAAAILAYAKSVNDGIDALNDLKDATGASIENLSGLEEIASRTGTSFETVEAALIKLNQVLASATPGSQAKAALDAIGLSAEQLRAVDPAEALRQVAVALSRYADDGNKARLVQELFGKSVGKIAPLLKDVADAGSLNARVTTEQAEAADRFNKQLFEMQTNMRNVARTIASPLVEKINELTEAFRLGGIAGESFSETLAKRLPSVSGITAAYRGDAEGVRQARIADGQRELKLLNDRIAAIDGLIGREKLRDELLRKRNLLASELAVAQIDPAANYGNEGRRKAPSVGELPDTDATKKAEAAAKKAADARLKLAELVARAQVDIEERTAKDVSEAWGFWEENQIKAAKERSDAVALQWKQVFDFIDDEQDRAIQEGDAFLKGIAKSGKEVGEELALVFSSAAGEAITNWQGVKGLLKGILQDIAQIALKKTVTDPLSKAVGGFLDGVDFGSILKGLVPKFDTGIDYVPRDMLAYIHRGERVVPAAENRASGGRTANYHFHVQAGASVDEWRRSQRQIAADMMRVQRRAGGLA